MKRFIKRLVFYGIIIFCSLPSRAQPFTLEQLMEACPLAKEYTPSLSPHKTLPGTIIDINGQRYEWHYFHFSDPRQKLPKNITFAGFILNQDLLKMKSMPFQPLDGLIFECFDAARAGADDGAYFNIVLRRVDE